MPRKDEFKWQLIDRKPDFERFLRLMMKQKLVGCDTETSGFDFINDHIIGMSFSFGNFNEGSNYYIPIRHQSDDKQLDADYVLDGISEFFWQRDIITVWHNAKFDVLMYKGEGLEIRSKIEDTWNLHFLLNELGLHGLEYLAKKKLQEGQGWKDVIKDERERIKREYNLGRPRKEKIKIADVTYDMVPIPIMGEYASRDTAFTRLLRTRYIKQLKQREGLYKLYKTANDLIPILADCEYQGVRVDVEYLKQLDRDYKPALIQGYLDLIEIARGRLDIDERTQESIRYLSNLEEEKKKEVFFEEYDEIEELFKEKVLNLDSPAQIKTLFEKFRFPNVKKTKTGARSTDKEVLLRLAEMSRTKSGEQWQFPKKMLDYRAVHTQHKNFVTGLLKRRDERDHVHTSYKINGADSGRFSSSNPNLQNITRGPVIRRAFIVPENKKFIYIGIDFSQVELRVAAHVSQDPALLQAYWNDADVHVETGCALIGVTPENLTKEQRTIAKIFNFGILYGMTPIGIANNAFVQYGMNLSEKEAEKYQTRFFRKYPVLEQWIASTKKQIRRDAQITHIFGRTRHFPKMHWKNVDRKEIEDMYRIGVNFAIQGAAADMFKIAMVRVGKYLKKNKLRTRIILNVHDELAFYWHTDELEHVGTVCALMEDFPELTVPVRADVAWSTTDWGSKQELKLS